ncbi:hypothetical protein [Thermodesulfovibrio sp.]|uniref:hypothetical protein n=1 Tax=Thermodesulfovibrio sp. TaxID=2067987 RepID=UPI0030AA774F
MNFQIKIFIVFVIVMVIIFSCINLVTIYFFLEEQKKHEKELISIYREILKTNPNHPLPPNMRKIGIDVELANTPIDEKFKEYSATLLLWEGLLLLSLSYLFYRVLDIISIKEREHEEFLRFIFFVLSHKIGNFLSATKTNIEILRLKPDSKVLDRIEKSCNVIYNELKKSMETIKKLPRVSKGKQFISINELIDKIISHYDPGATKIIISARDTLFETNKEVIEMILFLLLDNAFRYAHTKVHIKICKEAIAIRNDFSEIFKGSGIGLQIVEYLCKTYKLAFKYRARGEHFLVVLKLKK